jgi:hypothetical protein
LEEVRNAFGVPMLISSAVTISILMQSSVLAAGDSSSGEKLALSGKVDVHGTAPGILATQ